MSNEPNSVSNLELLPMLMTNDWFLPSDTKECKIPVPSHLLPGERDHVDEKQLEELFLREATEIQNALSQSLVVNAARVFVQPPRLSSKL